MNVVAKKTINEAIDSHPRCKDALYSWYYEVKNAEWTEPNDIKRQYPKASLLSGELVIFDIMGGSYRLCVKVAYNRRWIYIKWFGTHQEYDRISKLDGGNGFLKMFG